MLFMHNETGSLYELLILSISEDIFTNIPDGRQAFRLADFTLDGLGEMHSMKYYEFADNFTFIGFVF